MKIEKWHKYKNGYRIWVGNLLIQLTFSYFDFDFCFKTGFLGYIQIGRFYIEWK